MSRSRKAARHTARKQTRAAKRKARRVEYAAPVPEKTPPPPRKNQPKGHKTNVRSSICPAAKRAEAKAKRVNTTYKARK